MSSGLPTRDIPSLHVHIWLVTKVNEALNSQHVGQEPFEGETTPTQEAPKTIEKHKCLHYNHSSNKSTVMK